MGQKQIVARDLSLVLRDLHTLEKQGKLDPLVAMLLKQVIRLVEVLRRQVQSIN